MIETIDFSVGERRRVYISVTSIGHQPFEISNPSFILSVGNEIDDEGPCDIVEISQTEVLLGALIQPQRKGCLYDLKFTYEIYPSKLYYQIKVRVN